MKNLTMKKTLDLKGFTGKFYETGKKINKTKTHSL